jgi:hypothetical protein
MGYRTAGLNDEISVFGRYVMRDVCVGVAPPCWTKAGPVRFAIFYIRR